MHLKTAKKILADEETIDIAETAEAILEEKKHEKKKRPPSVARVLDSWNRKRARIKETEEIRQALAKVWNKRKNENQNK
jgi:hypothetical protein